PRYGGVTTLVGALAVMILAAAALAGLLANQQPQPLQETAARPSAPATTAPRPSPPPQPNDGWFISAPPGTTMRANEVITDPDMLPLYLDEELADAIVDAGFERVRMRSYYAGASGGGTLKIIDVRDTSALLRRMRRNSDARPMRGLPRAHVHDGVVQMESTRAHDVFAHFRTVTFLSDPYVVDVEVYGLDDAVARQRAQ